MSSRTSSIGSRSICRCLDASRVTSSGAIRSGAFAGSILKPARLSAARYCAWLLEEGGLPVRTITTSRQREVIWRDAHQIVTKPSADLPKAFP
ncbi:hypothetical protein J4G48_0038480 [Bradyrhizobium barranii subsp. apii]|uniref:hypothetical protein n=1 Tax=Bradyrhizobium barranii TaxID=2992140 RepID=UPI001AA16F83|nr:hypothetical protein [Bradyrhizobium barranii]UPT95065.1 hypothetical protein J4G48_0038480 [Bradyrhizobium barranii subsp. apii]